MFGQYFKHVLILTLLAGLTYSLPQVKDAMADAFTIGYTDSSAYTAAAGNLSKAASNPVSVKETRAKVVFDSRHQESSIAITSKVQVTAVGTDLKINDTSFYFVLRNKTLNVTGAYPTSSSVTSNLKKGSDGYFTVRAGSSALFTVAASTNPKSMIAGQYTASLTAVVTDNNKIQPPANSSNTFVVVGEPSPYITLVGQGLFGTEDSITLNTVRLGKNPTISFQDIRSTICPVGRVCPAPTPLTFSLRGNSNSKQVKFDLSGKGITPSGYNVYVTNTELGSSAGRSNNVYVQVLDQSKILTAKVMVGKLGLTYDSQNQEATLSAQFEATIKANDVDITFDQNSFFAILNSSTYSTGVDTKLISVDGQNASFPYTLKAKKQSRFLITATINPKILTANTYTMSLRSITGSTNADTQKVYFRTNDNQTKPLAVVGEVSPYINSVTPNPATVGQTFSVNGVRLNDSTAYSMGSVFIDGVQVSGVDGSKDGSVLFFKLPSITDGYHMLYVKNANGQSNNVWFESTGAPQPASLIITSPQSDSIFTYNQTTFSIGVTWDKVNFTDNPNQYEVILHSLQPAGGINLGRVDGNINYFTITSSSSAALKDFLANSQTLCPVGYKCTNSMNYYVTVNALSAEKVIATGDSGRFAINYTPAPATSIITALDPSSPLDRTVQISNSAVTANVVLGVFDLKSQGSSSTLRNLRLNMDAYGPFSGNSPDTLFTNIKIKVGSLTYFKSSLGPTPVGENGVKVNFSDLSIPLPADANIPVTVIGDVAINTSNSLSSSTAQVYLYPNQTNIVAEDANYNPATVILSPGVLTSARTVFVAGPSITTLSITNTLATLGAPIMSGNAVTAYPATFKFSVTAPGNTIYISNDPNILLATTSTGYAAPANSSTGLTDMFATPGNTAGDSQSYFVIPSGTTREFTFNGLVKNDSTGGLKTFSIVGVNYGTTGSALKANIITTGLTALKVSPVFPTVTPIGWSAQINSGQRSWSSIASSVDGMKLVASSFNGYTDNTGNGYVYISNDAGKTWEAKTSIGQRRWSFVQGVAVSGNGTKIAAITDNSPIIYISLDGGNTWSQKVASGTNMYSGLNSVAISKDGGTFLLNNAQGVFLSKDNGNTWKQILADNLHSYLALSDDGNKIFVANTSWAIKISLDGGNTWTTKMDSGTDVQTHSSWQYIVTSSDGRRSLAAAVYDYLYTSNDFGDTWTPITSAGQHHWRTLTSSADGKNLTAISIGENIFESHDYGVTWVENITSGGRTWLSSATSADGLKTVVAPDKDYIYSNF